MPTFYDVYHAPLDKLKTAADDWAEMTAKLERLAEDARTTMAEKSKDEYWRGANARSPNRSSSRRPRSSTTRRRRPRGSD
ncbi:hypothetical protein [Streptomyces sp. NPDC092295]|uniref:hypothetical protein n=1 Tax=Streptomyces sp. NPDC092295 TaxID=3366011 RepID=UPI003801DE8F